jgi:hypothetical protein
MKNLDLIKDAKKRLAAATELLNQLWAVQSLADQKVLDHKLAEDEVNKLADDYHREIENVAILINKFLQNGDCQES